MMFTTTQIVALGICVAVKQALGVLWYSPILFGRASVEAAGTTLEDLNQRIRRSLLLDSLLALLTAAALTVAANLTGASSWFYGLLMGLAAWACFVLPSTAAAVLFEGRSAKLLGLQNGYLVVSYAAMGAIVGGAA
jgi:hypothetical protein